MRADDAPMRGRAEKVFAFLDALVSGLSLPSGLRELLRAQLAVGRGQAEARPQMPAVQLPLLTHAGVTGEEEPALPVAAACTLVYLGADLFDSVVDGELPPSWRERSPAEVNLTATTLLATLPQLSLARLREGGTPPEKLWMLTRLFAEAVLTMSAGQYEDLLFSHRDDVSLGESRTVVERKSAAANALFARAGAVLATEDPAKVRAYAAFGTCLGMARQLMTDLWDIWGGGASQDLSNGRRTLPVVHALSTLPEEERGRLRGLLAAAAESSGHQDGVRRSLGTAGSLRYTTLVVWLYDQQARDRLAEASPREPAGRELRRLLDGASLPHPPTGAPPPDPRRRSCP